MNAGAWRKWTLWSRNGMLSCIANIALRTILWVGLHFVKWTTPNPYSIWNYFNNEMIQRFKCKKKDLRFKNNVNFAVTSRSITIIFDRHCSSIRRVSRTIRILLEMVWIENLSIALSFNRKIVTRCPSSVNDGKMKYWLIEKIY